MLTIILGILKFIGLLFLVILGVFLIVFFSVLLVPIRYRAQGDYYEKPRLKATVSWLLHIFSLQVSYDGEFSATLRLFGFRLKNLSGRDRAEDSGADREESPEPEEPGEVIRREETAERLSEEEPEPKTEREFKPGPGLKDGRRRNPIRSFVKRVKEIPRKIRVTFCRFCGKLKKISEQKERFFAFVRDEDNKKTFRLLKGELKRLLKHIFPGKIKGEVKFGFDDPYTTGQALMYISPFYGWYAKSLKLIPVFEERVLEGELDMRGRIRIGTLVMIAVRLFSDKNFRLLVRKWREA